jgi:hypothetical protein
MVGVRDPMVLFTKAESILLELSLLNKNTVAEVLTDLGISLNKGDQKG